MNDLEMLPDDFDTLQRLLLKVNRDLNKSIVNKGIADLNGQSRAYYFLNDLNKLLENNKDLLEGDLFMSLFYIRKKLVK
jgi:hypothetical protein